MAFNISSAKLTGNPGVSGWAQVHEFAPEDPEKLKLRGHLFAVVATGRAVEGVDSVVAGRELLARLHEEYFGKLEGTALNTLKSAVEKVMAEFTISWGEVEIAAICHVGDVVYSVVGGGGEAAIFRNGMLAKILVSPKEGVVSASGFPKEEDILLLGTKLFFESIPNGVIKAALETSEAQLAAENLAPAVQSKADSGSLGAIIIKFKKESGLFTPAQVQESPEDIQNVVKNKLSLLIAGATSGLSRLVNRLPQRKIYVRGVGEEETELPQSKRTMVTVGIVLVALLIVSIGFGIRQKRLKDEKGRYQPKLSQAQHEFDEANSLVSLNSGRARELFVNARGIVNELKGRGIKDPALEELISRLRGLEGSVLGEYTESPQLFQDLSLQTSGFKGDDIAASGEEFFVLDKKGGRIIGVAFDTKKTEVSAGPDQVEGAKFVAAYEGRIFILTDLGVYEVGSKKTKIAEKDWQGEVIPHVYAGNLYLLDKGAGTIWRLAGQGEAFGGKQKWLGAGVEPDFSNIKEMAIDGSIWVFSQNGRILRFAQGSPQAFNISGLAPVLTAIDAIYTDQDQKYLYILDKAGSRVVVLDKNGEYKAQYLSDTIKEATGLVVSEKGGKIILLSGSKLYSLAIKHPLD